MSFDWSQYLNVAKQLAGHATTPANQEARLRAAISRAYPSLITLTKEKTD